MSTVQNEYECYECKFNPNYHSFHYLAENNEEIYYYTCPVDSINYNDPDGFIKHVHIELQNSQKPWIWIIDLDCFGLKLARYNNMHNTILKIIDLYSRISLKKVIIINQTFYSRCIINYSWYSSLPKNIKYIIIFDKNNYFSTLLNIDEKLNALQLQLTF